MRGVKYEGLFARGQKSGKGCITSSSGDRYSGELLEDRRHGQGLLRKADGLTYEGQYHRGRRQGAGRLTYPDGSTYIGQYHSDVRQGCGQYISDPSGPSPLFVRGEWHMNRLHGWGEKLWVQRISDQAGGRLVHYHYIGEFNKGEPHGRGRLYVVRCHSAEYLPVVDYMRATTADAAVRLLCEGRKGQGKELVCVIDGECQQGRFNGHGVIEWGNGDHYEVYTNTDPSTRHPSPVHGSFAYFACRE